MQLTKNNPSGKGVRTVLQVIIGFFVGLFVVVWQVKGVPQAVLNYVYTNLLPIAGGLGLSSGLVTYVWNKLEQKFLNR